MVFCFFLRLQIRIFLRVPTVRLSFLKNPEGKTFNAVTVTCVHLFRTGLLMICYLRLGILLSKEGFIFLDLVHQRKRAIMPFVRLENVTSINDAFNFYWINFQTQAFKPTWLTINVCVVYLSFLQGTLWHRRIVHFWNKSWSPTRDTTFLIINNSLKPHALFARVVI